MTWGLVYCYHPRLQTLWDYLVSEAGVPMSWVYPMHGGDNGNVNEPWRRHINCVADDVPGPFVVVTPEDGHNVQGTRSLFEFDHPEDCRYVFGSDRYNLALDDDAVKLHEIIDVATVYIPGVGKALHSPLAAAMVVYDRIAKGLG